MERGIEDCEKKEERKDECKREDAPRHAGMNEEARRSRDVFPSCKGEIGGDGKRESGNKKGREGISSSLLHAHAHAKERKKKMKDDHVMEIHCTRERERERERENEKMRRENGKERREKKRRAHNIEWRKK